MNYDRKIVKDAIDVYLSGKVKPKRGVFFSKDNRNRNTCCCAVSAAALAKEPTLNRNHFSWTKAGEILNRSQNFISAMVDGFDKWDNCYLAGDTDRIKGYATGVKIRERLEKLKVRFVE